MELWEAAWAGELEKIEKLISVGADVNYRGFKCSTPLAAASLYGHKDVVEILLKNGADLEAKTEDGQTLRVKATRKIMDWDAENHQNIKFLISVGVDYE